MPAAQETDPPATSSLLAIGLLVAGALLLYLGVARPLLDVVRARSWVRVPVTSGKASLLYFHGVLHAKFTYGYEFSGSKYSGARYAFVHPTSFLSDSQMQDLQSPARFSTAGYVNPRNPSESVIERELPPGAYRWRGAIFFACGALLWWWRRRWPAARGWAARLPAFVLRLVGVGCALWGIAGVFRHSSLSGVLLGLILSFGLAASLLSLWPPALRLISVLLIGGTFLILLGGAFNPFAWGDLPTDELHDFAPVLEYMATWIAGALIVGAIAMLARLMAAMHAPAQSERASMV